jgi:guanylate kinase
MNRKSLIYVISAPSGAGKTTICRHLSKKNKKLKYSISCTTRPKRPGEKNGIDYHFLNENEFKKTAKSGGFAEWALVHGYYYGTPKKILNGFLKRGFDVIMDIDVQGGLKMKSSYPEAVLIFVMTPSFKELGMRLKLRRKDNGEIIKRRLHNACNEVKSLPRYEYLVINDKLKKAEKEVEAIIEAEHRRIKLDRVPKFE